MDPNTYSYLFTRFCVICQRYVSSGNQHCEICDSCTSKVSILTSFWVMILAQSNNFCSNWSGKKKNILILISLGNPRHFKLVVLLTSLDIIHNLLGINFCFLIPFCWKEDWKGQLLATKTTPFVSGLFYTYLSSYVSEVVELVNFKMQSFYCGCHRFSTLMCFSYGPSYTGPVSLNNGNHVLEIQF